MENVGVWKKIGNGLIHLFLHPFSFDHLPSIFKIKWCFSTSLWIGSKNNTMTLNTIFWHGISGILAILTSQITAFLSHVFINNFCLIKIVERNFPSKMASSEKLFFTKTEIPIIQQVLATKRSLKVWERIEWNLFVLCNKVLQQLTSIYD